MSAVASASTSHSDVSSIFNTALETYRRKTKKDLVKHPLLPKLQSCDSSEAILTVLREQFSASSQSQDSDNQLTTWVAPTVNVLYSFSGTLGGVVGLVNIRMSYDIFKHANILFTGIGVLLAAVKDTRGGQDKLIDCIRRFFQRLEVYVGITPSTAMTDIIVDIMVEVLKVLAMVTQEVKRGRLIKYLRKLVGITDVEDSLQRLDRLTQEEARMASVELLRVTRR